MGQRGEVGNQSSEDRSDAALNNEKIQSIVDVFGGSPTRDNYMSGKNDSRRTSSEDQKWKPFKLFRKGRKHRDLISDTQMSMGDSLVAQFQCEVDRRLSSSDYAHTKPSPIAEGRGSLASDKVSPAAPQPTERGASIDVAGLSRSPALRVPPVLREQARQWRESYKQLNSQRNAAPQIRLANIREEREEAVEISRQQEQSMPHRVRRNRFPTQRPSLEPRSLVFPTANQIPGPASLQEANDPRSRLKAARDMLGKHTADTSGVEEYHSSNLSTPSASSRAPSRQAAPSSILTSPVRKSSEVNGPEQTDSPSSFDQGLYAPYERGSTHKDAELNKSRLELEKRLDLSIQSLRHFLSDGGVESSVPEQFAQDLLTVPEATSSTASKSPMEVVMAPDSEAPTAPVSTAEITEVLCSKEKPTVSNPAAPESASPLSSEEQVLSGCRGEGQEERGRPNDYKRPLAEQADWLSRQELTQRLEKLRDARFNDMEKRLERLERNRETLMNSMVPLLENINLLLEQQDSLPVRRHSRRQTRLGDTDPQNAPSPNSRSPGPLPVIERRPPSVPGDIHRSLGPRSPPIRIPEDAATSLAEGTSEPTFDGAAASEPPGRQPLRRKASKGALVTSGLGSSRSA
ncbi:hypothetical protein DL769_005581 [Monosporascus sp. CRB-8-3]|nr:hypothetical protein DL769_005581 [Monosporascus sp. CRB-8-3]